MWMLATINLQAAFLIINLRALDINFIQFHDFENVDVGCSDAPEADS